MSTDVDAGRPTSPARSSGRIAPLARREAWRMMTSPALAVMAVYFLLVAGIDTSQAEEGLGSLFNRATLASVLALIVTLFMGLVTFVSAHLVASSARRAGAGAQLDAAPMSPRRRDLGLCLAVAIGPALTALLLALTSAWLASGVPSADGDLPGADGWSITDVIQVTAVVLGAGILGIVVARWLPLPGSLLVGFLGMCLVTVWMTAPALPALRSWYAWFPVIPWLTGVDPALTPTSSMAWHGVYLLAWCWVGVCAVALRHPNGRRPWLAALGVGAVTLSVSGLAQLAGR